MRKSKRLEGHFAPLFFSAAGLVLAGGTPVLAQSIDVAALESCTATGSAETQLRCIEALIVRSKAALQPPANAATVGAATPAAETAPATETPAAPVAVATVPAAQAPHADSSASAVTATRPAADAAPAPAIAAATGRESAPPSTPNAVAEPRPATSDFGAEHLEQRNDADEEDDRLRATVTSVTGGRNRTLSFHLDNGQVWRQTEARHFRYPKNTEFEVTISRGIMGDYRLRIGDDGQMVRIRRVK